MAKLLTKLQNWLLALLVFVIPANLFYKISEKSAYVDGLLVDYLIPKIYLQNLLILLILVIALVKLIAQKKLDIFFQKIVSALGKNRLLMIVILLLFVKQFFALNYLAAIWFFAKLTILAAFFLWLKRNYSTAKNQCVFWALVFSLIFQALLAGYQLITQKQLLGYLFLGEPNLQQSFALAQGSLRGNLITLPYGTTAHPNILAGWGVLAWWLMLKIKVKKNKFRKLAILSSTICLILILFVTQSVSAILAFLMAVLLLMVKKKRVEVNNKLKTIVLFAILLSAPLIISLLGIQSTHPSITRRNFLNQAAYRMSKTNLLTGVGLNNFTAHLEKFASNLEAIRFIQPAHNFMLLWTAETGILGILLLLLATSLIIKNSNKTTLLNILLIIAPILSLDHYLLTITTGQIILLLTIFLTKNTKSS